MAKAIAKNRKAAYRYTIKKNTVAVVSDGSSVLGLGNLGAEAALPVMEGKALLMKELAGIDAWPVCLSVQDAGGIVEAVRAVSPVYGGLNLEDIAAPRCFEVESRLRREMEIPVFHDDQHGTAVAALAAVINALKITGREKETARVIISGAGAAGAGVTRLLIRYGFKDISVTDSRGVISPYRKDLSPVKREIASLTNPRKLCCILRDALKGADVFIGVSAGGIVSQKMVESMNPGPVVLALANPDPEILPEEALEAGAAVVATGRSDYPNQVNNILVFPGIWRGVLDSGLRKITGGMLIKAAEALARYTGVPSSENLLPDPLDKGVCEAVAAAVSSSAYYARV